MRPRSYVTDPFTDLLFNALLGITFLFLISIMFINPIAKLGNASLKAEYIISVTWPENLPDDIDIWVEDPHGEIVSYLQKDAGWLHLDRDDRGNVNDTIIIDGEQVVHPINQEIITIRGIISGEYVVNLYFYDKRSSVPVAATVKIEKVNPSMKTVFVRQLELDRQDVEETVLRFTLDGSGEFGGVDYTPKILTPYRLDA